MLRRNITTAITNEDKSTGFRNVFIKILKIATLPTHWKSLAGLLLSPIIMFYNDKYEQINYTQKNIFSSHYRVDVTE